MSPTSILLLVAISFLCGSVGQWLAGRPVGGLLVSAGVGFLGAMLGMWLADAFALPALIEVRIGGTYIPLVWSFLGSAILVALLGFFTGGKRW